MGLLIELASIVREILSHLGGWVPAVIAGAFAVWTANKANKIATDGADRAMEVAKAGRADQLNQPIFEAKLAAYRELSVLVQRNVRPATILLRKLSQGEDSEDYRNQLKNASDELTSVSMADCFLYSTEVLTAEMEFQSAIHEVVRLSIEQATAVSIASLRQRISQSATIVAVRMSASLGLPTLEILTATTIGQAIRLVQEEAQERKTG